nr:putative ribonuclease h protein [Quercus suber]
MLAGTPVQLSNFSLAFGTIKKASSKVPSARPRLNAKWDKPLPSWYKLNTDASIINGHAGASGLLRDSNGTWVQGFSKPLGTAMVLMAELWALREGLRMARQLNIYYLIVSVDSSDVVKLFSSSSSTNRLTWPLVAECRDILQAFQQVQLSHCFREANHAADLLAKIGSSQWEDFVYYVTPPFSLLDVLAFECASDNAPNVSINTEAIVSFDTRFLAG